MFSASVVGVTRCTVDRRAIVQELVCHMYRAPLRQQLGMMLGHVGELLGHVGELLGHVGELLS